MTTQDEKYAFIGAGNGGVIILDINDKQNIQISNQIGFNNATAFGVMCSQLFNEDTNLIVIQFNEIIIFSLENILFPTRINSIKLQGQITQIELNRNNTLIFAASFTTLYLIDFSDF